MKRFDEIEKKVRRMERLLKNCWNNVDLRSRNYDKLYEIADELDSYYDDYEEATNYGEGWNKDDEYYDLYEDEREYFAKRDANLDSQLIARIRYMKDREGDEYNKRDKIFHAYFRHMFWW